MCNGANLRRPTACLHPLRLFLHACQGYPHTYGTFTRLDYSHNRHTPGFPQCHAMEAPNLNPQSLFLSPTLLFNLIPPRESRREKHNICGTQDTQRLFRLLNALLLRTQDWELKFANRGIGLGEQTGGKEQRVKPRLCPASAPAHQWTSLE